MRDRHLSERSLRLLNDSSFSLSHILYRKVTMTRGLVPASPSHFLFLSFVHPFFQTLTFVLNRKTTNQTIIMPEWIDYTPDLTKQDFCTRLLCWPCQCGLALTNAFAICDMNGFCAVLCCCPCRTLCGACPTKSEIDEPETMAYHAVSQN